LFRLTRAHLEYAAPDMKGAVEQRGKKALAEKESIPIHLANRNTGLSPATAYYYRVRAYKASANSDYSNEAAATTSSAGGGGGGGEGCFMGTAAPEFSR
jgi:phosphodiesterase/alkaline phosphatase D-like protein